MLEYSRMSMKEIDGLRGKVREAGGQVHVTKNTLMRRALTEAGIQNLKVLEGTTLSSFAFGDAPVLAKSDDGCYKKIQKSSRLKAVIWMVVSSLPNR